MGKNKIKHELIPHEPSRRVTFKKRKANLFKKLEEITTLCGVIACAFVYNSFDGTEVDVWPSPQGASGVLEKFKSLPAKKQSQFMMDQEVFLRKNMSKLTGQLEKVRMKNQGLEELLLTEYLEGKNLQDSSYLERLIELQHQLDKRIDSINNRIKFIEGLKSTQVDAGIDSDETVNHGVDKNP